jgi:hypothetical protein
MNHQSKVGPGGAGPGGAPAPWVRPHPGPAQWPLPCSSGLLAGLGGLAHRFLGPIAKLSGIFVFVLLKYVTWKVYFVVFGVCACKTYTYQNL